MKSFNHPIKGGFGRCLKLDKEYNRYLEKELNKIQNDDILHRWDIYNLIMEKLIDLNKRGKIDASYTIWAILALDSWLNQFNSRKS